MCYWSPRSVQGACFRESISSSMGNYTWQGGGWERDSWEGGCSLCTAEWKWLVSLESSIQCPTPVSRATWSRCTSYSRPIDSIKQCKWEYCTGATQPRLQQSGLQQSKDSCWQGEYSTEWCFRNSYSETHRPRQYPTHWLFWTSKLSKRGTWGVLSCSSIWMMEVCADAVKPGVLHGWRRCTSYTEG